LKLPGLKTAENREEDLVPAPYEIRVAGRIDETAAGTLAGLHISTRGPVTIITGEFDQAALHGLLERIRTLGLDLVEARRLHGLRRASG
jgi:hypothetical protein